MTSRRFLAEILLTFVIISYPQLFSAATYTDRNNDIVKEEIWALEEAYFTNLYKANYDEALAVVHNQFLGWPHMLSQPIDKEESACFMKKLFPKPTSCTLKIEREGIRVLNDVALTEYTLNVSYTDSSTGIVKTQSSLITHTWTKEDTNWKLLGGISYVKQYAL